MSFVEGNGGLSAVDIAAVTNGNGGFGWGAPPFFLEGRNSKWIT